MPDPVPQIRDRHWTIALILLAAVALLVRLWALLDLRNSLFLTTLLGDSLQFDVLARRILAGEWADSGQYYQGALYPYFVALVYGTVGDGPLAIRTVQACLSAAACVMLAVAGGRFFDRRAGLAAGLLMAFYPPAIFFDAHVQKSSPDLFFMAILLAAVGVCLQRPQTVPLLLIGFAIGALSWNRENARVLYPVILAWIFLYYRATALKERIRWGVLVTAGAAIVLVPVAIRNYSISGELFLTSSQSGPNFYIGNHAGASGGYEPLVPRRGDVEFERQDAIRLAEAASGRKLTPSEVSDYWWDLAFADIRKDPAAWLRLLMRKTWLTFSASEPIDTESLEAYADYARVLRIHPVLTFGVLLTLGAFGGWAWRDRTRELAVLYAMFAALALSVIAFFVFARYRFPLAPIAALFAGAGIVALPAVRGRRDLLAALAGCAVIGVLLHVPVRTSSDETYANYGMHFLRIGRPADAVPMLKEAVRRDPTHVDARLSLALALQRISQPLEAIDVLREATVASPQSVAAHTGLAAALHQQGRVDEALQAYERAIALDPKAVEARSNMAVLLQQQGRMEQAVARLGEAVLLRPNDVPLLTNLGTLLLEVDRPREASEVFDRAVAAAKTPAETLQASYAAGQAYAMAGDIETAIVRLERALAVARSSGDASAIRTIESGLQLLRSRR